MRSCSRYVLMAVAMLVNIATIAMAEDTPMNDDVVMATDAECFPEGSHFSAKDWTYCQHILPDLFMYYKPFPEEGNLMLGFHAVKDTFGWTALAIAGNGGMKGASQIVVRKEGKGGGSFWVAEDRHSTDYAMPELDDSQDVTLLFARQTDEGETSWGVLLPMNSCDEFDYPIQNISVFMHWAIGNDHTFGLHEARGQFHANLLQAPQEKPSTEGLDYTDILMPNVDVVLGEGGADPSNPYICSFFDLQVLIPELDPQDKAHIIRLAPVLDQASEQYVHHMILYSCENDSDEAGESYEHLQLIPECASMPSGCSSMKWPWAVGSEEIVLPDDVGLPLGEGQRWLVLQTHYYNPYLDENVKDNSGVRAYYTTELRSQDAGVMQFNGGTDSWQRDDLPAGESNIALLPFVVPSSCTSSAWNDELTILGVVHHMHLAGMKMDIDVERDGRNLGPLRLEHNYDFNHQSLEGSPVRTLLPGDQFAMHCRYDTSKLSEDVAFGDLTQQEMCYAVVMYYPRQVFDSFGHMRPPIDKELCLTAGSDELGLAEVSGCSQLYATNVPAFYNFDVETPFDAVTMCNSDWYLTDILPFMPDSCPDCYVSKNCTSEDVVVFGQQILCQVVCGQTGVSVFPNVTMSDGYDQGAYGCPTADNMDPDEAFMYFYTPELLPMAACDRVGDLSQVIELQPVAEVVEDQSDGIVNSNVTEGLDDPKENAEAPGESTSASRWSFLDGAWQGILWAALASSALMN